MNAALDTFIRPATPHDIDAVAGLGLEALRADPMPNLRISEDKVYEMTREVISGAAHYCHVVEDKGVVMGAVSALVHEIMFYERRQATVVQFYCTKPGWGTPLLRDFLAWARGRRAIKMIVFSLEHGVDERIGLLLQRLGLSRDLPVYVETK